MPMFRLNVFTRRNCLIFALGLALFGAASVAFPRSRPFVRQSSSTEANNDTSKAEQDGLPAPVPRGKKLILTNGNYEIVREYSVEGDRVRYWSLERSAWEEIPASLVDWDATHKADAEEAKQQAALNAKIAASESAEREQAINIDRSLEIKPGIILPDDVGFYVLDGKRVLALKQDSAVSKIDKGRAAERIITGVPLIPSRLRFELPGERADLRISSDEPEFYMRPADAREPRFALVRAQIKNGSRVLESTSQSISGEQNIHSQEIEFQVWTPAQGVFRYTVDEQLTPGEYAFIEATADGVSAYVWDFGVDPPPKAKK